MKPCPEIIRKIMSNFIEKQMQRNKKEIKFVRKWGFFDQITATPTGYAEITDSIGIKTKIEIKELPILDLAFIMKELGFM